MIGKQVKWFGVKFFQLLILKLIGGITIMMIIMLVLNGVVAKGTQEVILIETI